MKQKVRSILDHMVRGEGAMIKGYEETSNGFFKLETELSQFKQQTYLKYEFTSDNEMFRIEIMHIFGYLDVRIPPQTAAAQLLRMLEHNTGSFGSTTAYIGVTKPDDATFHITFNSFHHFVTEWSDADIAKALSLHFFDMVMGFMTMDTSLTMMKVFGGNN